MNGPDKGKLSLCRTQKSRFHKNDKFVLSSMLLE